MTEALSGLIPKDHPGKENASATSFLTLSHERKGRRLGAELCDLKDRRFKGTERTRADTRTQQRLRTAKPTEAAPVETREDFLFEKKKNNNNNYP